MKELVGVYAGTFDPITKGHMDMAKRAAKIVDKLIIGVAENTGKETLFNLEERIALAKAEVESHKALCNLKIEVRPVKGLLIEFAKETEAKILFRGLRAVSDFEYEFKLRVMNARLDPDVETVFLMASEQYQFVSSVFVKEIGRLGGDISSFVSEQVEKKLKEKFSIT
ncbi:MAG: pantetheine-phosphate adenylyltransferase [Alphaproteobacteria bacterium]|nr:pantetheine-phosphate adenylyltransferase [Alphaproteobacteria bacterium]